MKEKEKNLPIENKVPSTDERNPQVKENAHVGKSKKKTTKKSDQEVQDGLSIVKELPQAQDIKKKNQKQKQGAKQEEKTSEPVRVEKPLEIPQTEEAKKGKEHKSKKERKRNRVIPKEELEKKKLTIPFISSTSTKDKKKKVQEVERFSPNKKIGLSKEEVAKRVEQGLVNRVDKKNSKTYTRIFLSNIFTFFNLLCFGVCGALIAVNAWSNLIFMGTILSNILIGIIQEIKAKKTVEKISLVAAPTAIVLREGQVSQIPTSEVVLDDLLQFQLGKQICADCVVVEGEVEVNESLLTGESVPVKKRVGDKLYSGSFIASGKCVARVDKVGNDSYIAKLSSKAKQLKKPKSELLNSLNIIIRVIAIVIIPIAILMYFNNYHQLGIVSETIKKTAGAIIGMIPAGMFLLTSLALVTGVVKLAKRRTLVQDMYSIEMLARTDVLCLDKTGTITDGTMKVNNVIQLASTGEQTLGEIMGSMLTALDDNNATTRALANHFGYNKDMLPKEIIPFSSARKYSAVTFRNGETYAYGAPEFVLKTKNPEIDKTVKQYAQKGFRMLLLAKCKGSIENGKLPQERTPLALIVIQDHIREDAYETIKWFKENKVAVKIISGDNPMTVSEVSRRVGVENAEKWISLEGLTTQQVVDAADQYTVFGRVSPEQKCVLVKALKAKGHTVAMTGDGVNDILALKEADCSIAMASGSEATRNVSHLVLMDSNFSSMPSVVAEGRRVVNNVQKSSSLFLMKTLFTIFLSIFCIIVGVEYPFSTNQILMLEWFVIGAPSFCLALQPNKERIRGKFLPNLLARSLPGAIIFTLNVVACYYFDVWFGTQGQYITMASLIVTISGLLVLYSTCVPLDIFRGFLCLIMVALVAITLSVVPFSFFEYVPITDLKNILFMIVLVEFTYPFHRFVVNTCNKVFERYDR